ncbi:hypothetical protein M8J76_009420 [Diaphorina citri]|nr:hypothetical protein M8J76_009420 [Diaphorina citri]
MHGYANTYENKSQTTKLITIIYTIIGLPIFLIYVTNIGLVLAQFAKNCFIHSMCCCLCSKCGYCCYDEILMEEKERRMRVKRQRNEFKKELEKGNLNQPYYLNINYVHEYNNYKHKTKDFQKRTEKTKLIAPLVLSILIICAYILLGSIFICNLEPGVWKLVDCLFYTFSLLTTIGVNDQLIPINSNLRMTNNASTSILWFVSFYIVIGLSFNSMFLNLIFDVIKNRIRNKRKRRTRSNNNNCDAIANRSNSCCTSPQMSGGVPKIAILPTPSGDGYPQPEIVTIATGKQTGPVVGIAINDDNNYFSSIKFESVLCGDEHV